MDSQNCDRCSERGNLEQEIIVSYVYHKKFLDVALAPSSTLKQSFWEKVKVVKSLEMYIVLTNH